MQLRHVNTYNCLNNLKYLATNVGLKYNNVGLK